MEFGEELKMTDMPWKELYDILDEMYHWEDQ